MCGICGQVNFDKQNKISENVLKKMSNKIRHRGPDDEGYYTRGNVGLGFRRLSIIDLKTGHQPLSNDKGNIWIVFNGEIYNFLDLRKNLVSKGYKFRTNTDTEVIVHLYEEYGENCVVMLRGMFGFAIWDERKNQIFCVRDRFGIKPFYYYCDGEKFVFASEIKAILAAQKINTALDVNSLDSFFTYGYIFGQKTIFKHIKKLEPGHFLKIALPKKDIIISRYWDIQFEPDYSTAENEWCELLENKLNDSVKKHLISDVPLGAFLSGGIDSSSVVALMQKHSDEPVKTFSIGFKERKFNEIDYAREIARKYNTDHHEMILEPNSVDLINNVVSAFDEPFADQSVIPTYLVSKFAREFVTVVLSGDGGDELFAGYTSYPKMLNIYKYNFMPYKFNKVFWGAIYNLIPHKFKGKNTALYLAKNKEQAKVYSNLYWNEYDRSKLLKQDIWQMVKSNLSEFQKYEIFNGINTNDLLFRMQALDMKTYLVEDILTKVDMASMLNSLEVRVPILDHEFAELTFKIPSNLKIKNGEKKYIFKKTMKSYLTDNILNHRKQGFSMPLEIWFKHDLNDYIKSKLFVKNSKLSNLINLNYGAKILEDHIHGYHDHSTKIWSLLVLDVWMDMNDFSI